MKFDELSWAAFCFYYRSVGDKKYCKLMRDTEFISKLRCRPRDISLDEFEEKVILDFVNISSYDLLLEHSLAKNILNKIVEVSQDIASLQDMTLAECDLSDSLIVKKITKIYSAVCSVHGLWRTGASKIAHILNDQLLPILNPDVSNHFSLKEEETGILFWLKVVQENAREATLDFQAHGLPGTPEKYISENLGYNGFGCHKSLVKFVDEYFWIHFGDNLPIPPRWIPPVYAYKD